MQLSPIPLHIPDGFLSWVVSLISWGITVVLVGTAIKRTQNDGNQSLIPLMGVMAAFIFAAQMINFPVAGGTSGHLLGGAFAAIVLGPWSGMLVMTCVIALQALLFQDGGLVVMGANILNMGLVTSLIGFGLYRAAGDWNRSARIGAAGFAAWLSVVAGALLTATQLWVSGTSPARLVFPAMIGVHAVIGVGEALITMAALRFILQTRPELLSIEALESRGNRGWIGIGIAASIAVVLLAPYASTHPDGLERVAEDLGFLSIGQSSTFQVLPDYLIPVLGESHLSTILAGAAGVGVSAAAAFLLGWSLRRPRKRES